MTIMKEIAQELEAYICDQTWLLIRIHGDKGLDAEGIIQLFVTDAVRNKCHRFLDAARVVAHRYEGEHRPALVEALKKSYDENLMVYTQVYYQRLICHELLEHVLHKVQNVMMKKEELELHQEYILACISSASYGVYSDNVPLMRVICEHVEYYRMFLTMVNDGYNRYMLRHLNALEERYNAIEEGIAK